MLSFAIPFLLAFTLVTIYVFRKILSKNFKQLNLTLLLFDLVIRVFVASYTDLHTWDEKYHALISKNIFDSVLVPKLYVDYLIPFDFTDWTRTEIWLSKPFLPFTIVGTSLKIFGNNLIGLRLPSVVLGVFCVWIVIRIATILFNQSVGFLTGYFYAIHGLIIELNGGKLSSDHVENVFLFFALLSVFFFVRNINKFQYLNFAGLGVALAFAFLSKWIMIFLIIFPMVLYCLRYLRSRKHIFGFIVALSSSFMVLTPYLIFIFYHHPVEAKFMFDQFLLKIMYPDPTHNGKSTFYLVQLGKMCGQFLVVPFVWSIYHWFKTKNSNLLFVLFWLVIPIEVLSICSTKRPTYLAAIIPPALILISVFVLRNFEKLNSNKIFKIVGILVILLPIRYSLERVKPFETRSISQEWRVPLETLIKENENSNIIIYTDPNSIKAMFYYDIVAYDQNLSTDNILSVKNKGYRVFKYDHGIYTEK